MTFFREITISVLIRTWCIKALYSTNRAERMLCLMSVKSISCQLIFALNQIKMRFWNYEMVILFHVAYRATMKKCPKYEIKIYYLENILAINYHRLFRGQNFKFDSSTMASSSEFQKCFFHYYFLC